LYLGYSAKGIARISARLPMIAAEEIVSSIIDMFSENMFTTEDGPIDFSAVSDATWHGACLATAELTRRGIFTPDHLHQMIPWVIKVGFFFLL
jgi:hypothetical protein